MLTCVIRYHIDPTKKAQFAEYARNWGQAIPRCGADLVGYFAPHEGSSTLAYGIYNVASLAEYEAYRARVPRFGPKFAAWTDMETITVSPKLFRITAREGMLFLLASPLFEFVEWIQDTGYAVPLIRIL